MTDTTDPKGNKTANEAAGNPAQPGGRSVEQIERGIATLGVAARCCPVGGDGRPHQSAALPQLELPRGQACRGGDLTRPVGPLQSQRPDAAHACVSGRRDRMASSEMRAASSASRFLWRSTTESASCAGWVNARPLTAR